MRVLQFCFFDVQIFLRNYEFSRPIVKGNKGILRKKKKSSTTFTTVGGQVSFKLFGKSKKKRRQSKFGTGSLNYLSNIRKRHTNHSVTYFFPRNTLSFKTETIRSIFLFKCTIVYQYIPQSSFTHNVYYKIFLDSFL